MLGEPLTPGPAALGAWHWALQRPQQQSELRAWAWGRGRLFGLELAGQAGQPQAQVRGPEHLELGGVGFAGPDNQGDAAIPRERKEGRPREEALAQGLGEKRDSRLFSATVMLGLYPSSHLFPPVPIAFLHRADGHRPTDLLVEKVREESTEFL